MMVTLRYGDAGLSNWSTLFKLESLDNLDDLISNKLMDSLWLLLQSAILVGVPIVILFINPSRSWWVKLCAQSNEIQR